MAGRLPALAMRRMKKRRKKKKQKKKKNFVVVSKVGKDGAPRKLIALPKQDGNNIAQGILGNVYSESVVKEPEAKGHAPVVDEEKKKIEIEQQKTTIQPAVKVKKRTPVTIPIEPRLGDRSRIELQRPQTSEEWQKNKRKLVRSLTQLRIKENAIERLQQKQLLQAQKKQEEELAAKKMQLKQEILNRGSQQWKLQRKKHKIQLEKLRLTKLELEKKAEQDKLLKREEALKRKESLRKWRQEYEAKKLEKYDDVVLPESYESLDATNCPLLFNTDILKKVTGIT
uniref:Uncharacterized protein n=1 Tax=Mucochytrium quahogii TaxID=96639 RepID=A0A7S2RA21_9STRA|mmetsp:Transcript_10414/g.19437  ORF Transcript_10414/g.19437 Transcript_10414/m.19437 type:complete len:284 (+) Transcript_10414:788-1639(+)|eukprot:CAMPEP_0203749072 /NCGR_PEP_ID=MMETSP0098-20131031/3761_1 /ASSEMBLY_ACC=CAM_ASM_000208 /TAXON_ID=96639 /ORGANISM=" , Strain NY0313808BC1" /LENGTH=283 /DNA_ID=CAMNT_0050638017 /DNA_START=675 /DNA_END=1526 /DNA_ORIENTATION=-